MGIFSSPVFDSGVFGGGMLLPILTFRQSANDTADAASYSFSSQAIGTAASDRLVIVAVHWDASSSRTISSATIGGVAATVAVQKINSGATPTGVGLIYAAVPTGTTATVAVTMSGGVVRMGIGLWTLTGHLSNTPTTTNSSENASSGTSLSASVTPSAGGVVVAAFSANNGGINVAWTNVTECYDDNLEAGGTEASGADVSAAAGTAVSCAAAYSAGGGEVIAVAAWR